MSERRAAVALRAPREQAETLRRLLHDDGLLDRALAPDRADDHVLFPLGADVADPRVAAALAAVPGAQLERHHFLVRPPRVGGYADLVVGMPDELRASLPTSFDVVGRIAVIKLPEAALPYRGAVGVALLQAHPHLVTAALDRGVRGELRVRDLEVLAGRPELTTVHREHGLEIEVPLDKAYFSPRLATERQRLVRRVQPGQRVLDLFAGVGAFVCLAAREARPSTITAIDLNPDAVDALRRNLDRNRIPAALVQVLQGDARAMAPRTHDWDHVVMNLPHDAPAYLDVAAACVAPDGEVHLYAMVERTERATFEPGLENRLADLTGRPWRVVSVRHVRNYSPTSDGLGYTLAPAPAKTNLK